MLQLAMFPCSIPAHMLLELVMFPCPFLHMQHGVPLLMEPAQKGFSMVTELLVQHGVKVDVESQVRT